MLMYEDIPDKLSKRIDGWISAKQFWEARAKEAFGYFFNDIENTGTTLTFEQTEKVKATTNIPVTINYQYPVLSQKHAILAQTKPSHRVVALSGSPEAKAVAAILDKAKYSLMYNSEAITHNEEAIKTFLICGMSHVGIVPKDFTNDGEFNLSYQHLPVWNITVDPNSRLKTNEDMQGYVYSKELTEDVMEKLYRPMITTIEEYYEIKISMDDLLVNAVSGANIAANAQLESLLGERKGLVRKYYDRTVATMYYVKNPETGEVDRMFRENMFPEQQVLIDASEVVKEEVNYFVRETTIIGKKILNVEILPLTLFPMKTMYFEWGGKPYRSYGMIHFTKGMQEAMDKVIQLLLLNAMLSNNAGWTAPKGSIADEDKAKWRIDGNNPMAIKEYVPRVLEGNILKPERDDVKPLAQHYPLIMDMMKQGIEYSTGINPMIQGDPRGAKVDVFSSLQQYQSAAMQRINLSAQHINQIQEYIGRVLVQWLPSQLKTNQYYGFYDQQGKFDEIVITKELIQTMSVENFTVAAIPAEAMPTYRMAQATELMKIAQTTPNPQEKNIYIKKAFALSDIRGFDDMEEELNEVNKLNSQIQQMQEQLERDDELMKQYENRALLAEYKAKLATMLSKTETDVNVAAKSTEKDMEIEKLKEQLRDAKKPKTE